MSEPTQPCSPPLMNREQAIAYINQSTSPGDRSKRKAEVFHTMYGNPESFKNWITQNTHNLERKLNE